jgi:hypothetical protein
MITDASAIDRVQVQLSSGERLTLYPRNGQWERIYPGTLAQGVDGLTFEAVDIASNVGVGTSTLVVDNTPPTFNSVSVEGSQPYTYQPEVQAAVPSAMTPLFYGVGTGNITVTVAVTVILPDWTR